MTRISFSTGFRATFPDTQASRCPSVATRVSPSRFRIIRVPWRGYRLSSEVLAKRTFPTMVLRAFKSRGTAFPKSYDGRAGKSSLGRPTIRNRDRAQMSWTQLFSSTLNLISSSGRRRTISKIFLEERVMAPGSVTFARVEVRTPSSRSVATSSTSFFPAERNVFERIGMVFFFSTTPWRRWSSFKRSSLRTVNSMAAP